MGRMFKPPQVRLGDECYMRGTDHVLTASRALGGCGLIRATIRGPGGGGGGMVRREPEENYSAPKKADGEGGSSGQLVSNTISCRPDTEGYVHRAGGSRGNSDRGSTAQRTATDGATPASASIAHVVASGGDGGRGAWLSYPNVSDYNRVASNVTNPDGLNTAGRGGGGGNKDSYVNPAYGASAGQGSRAWIEIRD